MLEICLGIQVNGKPLYTTLKQARHLVICGYTGCGKTELTYKIIEQLDDAQIYILNPLKIYYQDFVGRKNIAIALSETDIKDCLVKISNEINKRAKNYSPAAQSIVVIADGYQSYGLSFNFDPLPYLEQIANSEKANIHLILATQYTKQTYLFKNILLNSSIICMSERYRKLFLNYNKKHFPDNNNILAKIIGESDLIELVPNYSPLISKIQNNN